MPSPATMLFFFLGITIALLILLLGRPDLTFSIGGKILAFVAFLALPFLCGVWGLSEHFQRSEQTDFCLSCHIMEPYGRSLYVDDITHLPAAHFQNHRIPADQACFTCHTNYAMYGSLKVKLNGLRHVYVEYFGTPVNPIHLYQPFQNGTCLHCHSGARSFEDDTHAPMMELLKSNQLSCISSGCHDEVHDIESLNKFKRWKPTE